MAHEVDSSKRENQQQLLLGVDGGGSKTVAWLATCGDAASGTPSPNEVAPTASDEPARGTAPHVIGRGAAGPSNPLAIGFDEALANLDRAVDAAFEDAHLAKQCAAAATIGLAGADRNPVRDRIAQWAGDCQLARRVQVVHDALPVLAAATDDACGIALISGTGSFAFGRNARGETARAGGWGWMIGDEGSAFALARAALVAIAAAVDGRGPETALIDAVSRGLCVKDPSELIAAVYGHAEPRRRVASLAPLVVQVAEAGDAVAREIIERGAADLASLVAAVAGRLAVMQPFPLALSGGVLVGNQCMREELARQLAARRMNVGPVAVVAEPVWGAVRMAERVRSESV